MNQVESAFLFPESAQLNKELELQKPSASSKDLTIQHVDRSLSHLPGEPLISLESSYVETYLVQELLTSNLNSLTPYLWLAGTQKWDHISPLHQQIIKGRSITITEDPELHCTWIYDHVYLKPLPPYLLSWAFWQYFLVSSSSPIPLPQREDIRKAALGFLRTYVHLIKHPSDFRIAQDTHLIPSDTTYSACRIFFSHFASLSNDTVSPRYRFGELRLNRLNFWAKLFLRRFILHKVHFHYSYQAYFSRFYAPLLFLFAFFSTVLSAMQVELQSNSIDPNTSPGWTVFTKFCRWVSVFAMLVATGLALILVVLLLGMGVRELVFAVFMIVRNRQRRGVLDDAPRDEESTRLGKRGYDAKQLGSVSASTFEYQLGL